jgi:hypothetical protein
MEGGEGSQSPSQAGTSPTVVYEGQGETDFNMPTQGGEATADANTNNTDFTEELVNAPGTPHDKLSALAQMEEESDTDPEIVDGEIVPDNIPKRESLSNEEKAEDELTDSDEKLGNSNPEMNREELIEQQVILLQAEAIKMLANALEGKSRVDENEELLKKIRELLEKLNKYDLEKSKKELLIGAVLGVALLSVKIAEKGFGMVEEEAKTN